jgi:hypothetical protein
LYAEHPRPRRRAARTPRVMRHLGAKGRSAGGAITGGLNDGRDELGSRDWSDGGIRGEETRDQYRPAHRRRAGRPLNGRPAADAEPADG